MAKISKEYSLENVLNEWNGVAGITLSFRLGEDLKDNSEEE